VASGSPCCCPVRALAGFGCAASSEALCCSSRAGTLGPWGTRAWVVAFVGPVAFAGPAGPAGLAGLADTGLVAENSSGNLAVSHTPLLFSFKTNYFARLAGAASHIPFAVALGSTIVGLGARLALAFAVVGPRPGPPGRRPLVGPAPVVGLATGKLGIGRTPLGRNAVQCAGSCYLA
jgi:hypothetical protein